MIVKSCVVSPIHPPDDGFHSESHGSRVDVIMDSLLSHPMVLMECHGIIQSKLLGGLKSHIHTTVTIINVHHASLTSMPQVLSPFGRLHPCIISPMNLSEPETHADNNPPHPTTTDNKKDLCSNTLSE